MKISVIIPVYNKIRYISTVLQQVREQSFRDYECLLIDDGSTDGSGEVCDTFSAKDARFRVFHIPNGGVSHARNVGLDAARGEYITFIDADDEIDPDYLNHLMSCMESCGADLVISGGEKFWDDKEETVLIKHPVLKGLVELSDCLESFAQVQKDTGLYGFCCAKLFKRTFCADTRFDEAIRLAEDLEFYIKLYGKARKVYFDDACLYRYRQEAENSSMLTEDSNIDYYTQLCIQIGIAKFLENNNALTEENERIMTRRLYDYVFFCIFHSDFGDLVATSKKIKMLELPPMKKQYVGGMLRSTVLFLFSHHCHEVNHILIWCYRVAQKCKRFLKKERISK